VLNGNNVKNIGRVWVAANGGRKRALSFFTPKAPSKILAESEYAFPASIPDEPGRTYPITAPISLLVDFLSDSAGAFTTIK